MYSGNRSGKRLGGPTRPSLQQNLRQAIEKASKGEAVFFHASHYDIDGGIHYIDGSIKPVTDGEGKVVFLVPEGYDVTIRKQAQERLHRINDCFLNFGSDIGANINLLTELCGKLLQADFARYDHLKGGSPAFSEPVEQRVCAQLRRRTG